jgi:hypothetical protein
VRKVVIGAVLVLTVVLAGRPAAAQSRPLVTEDPETVPAGKILFETGVDYARDASYPVSGLRGNLLRIATFGLSFGVSPIAEIQLDGGVRNRLAIKSVNPLAPLGSMLRSTAVVGTNTSDVEDVVIGAKIRFMPETASRPALAVRFSTRLPNANNETGLGLDTTDFNFGFAGAKTVQSLRVVGNLGFGILGDPTRGDRQNDVINFGLSMARAVRTGFEVVGEINGRLSTRAGTAPPGTESRSTIRLGSRFTRGPVRLDGALFVGVTADDPAWGFTFGGTWVFKAFEVK